MPYSSVFFAFTGSHLENSSVRSAKDAALHKIQTKNRFTARNPTPKTFKIIINPSSLSCLLTYFLLNRKIIPAVTSAAKDTPTITFFFIKNHLLHFIFVTGYHKQVT
jgi:hypothetical protein